MPAVKRVLPRLKKGQYPTKRQLDRVAGRASDNRATMPPSRPGPVLSDKQYKAAMKDYKKAPRLAKKAAKREEKARKSINKKPLSARSRSGAASGRGGIRGGLGGGLFGPRVR